METIDICNKNFIADIKYIQDTLYVINGKWKILIILSVGQGNKRFGEIGRAIPKITKKMLSKELKELVANKLISRIVHTKENIVVEYELTEYCKTLSPLIIEMIKWGKYHRRVI